jgi:hypothetical protein
MKGAALLTRSKHFNECASLAANLLENDWVNENKISQLLTLDSVQSVNLNQHCRWCYSFVRTRRDLGIPIVGRACSKLASCAKPPAKQNGDPNGIRTRVTAVKGRCPRPLDDRVSERQISRRHPALQAAFVAGRPIKHRTLRRLARRNFFNECRCSHGRFSMRLNDAEGIGRQLFSLRGGTE